MASEVAGARPGRDTGAAREEQVPRPRLIHALCDETAALHHHLCPRQVLGIRLGLLGVRLLGLAEDGRYANEGKRLLTIAETDGCGADGISVATGCWVGRRTLRIVDYGKVAATLVDTKSGSAVRIAPHPEARTAVHAYAPDAPDRWHAYLAGYQVMPDRLLLVAQRVALRQPIERIISSPEARAYCDRCGEEIRNGREVRRSGSVLCLACAGDAYFIPLK